MSKYRGLQIGNQQIQSEHLVSGIAVNSVILSGNLTAQKSFQLQQSLGLQGQNVSYNLDSFLGTTGGTVTGAVIVVGTVSGSSSISVPSGSSLLVQSTLSGSDLLQALAGLYSSVTASALKRLTDGSAVTTGDHTHSLSSLSGQSEFELIKTATASGDTISLTSGTFSNIQVPSGTTLTSSDIEAFINGQLLEYGPDNGYLFSGGIVTFTAAIPGDFLSVIWRGSSATTQSSGSSGTTLSSGTGETGAGDSSSNQVNTSGSTTTSGTTLSSGTGGAGAGDSSSNQVNTSGSTTTSGTTLSSGTGDVGSSGNTLPAPSSIQFNESGTASWSAIAGTSAYQYQFTTSSTPTSSWTTTPSLGAYQSLSEYGGQTVYLFVRAENSSNYGTASRAVPYAAPASASLTSGGSASWSAVSGATNYQYQISLSSTPDSSWTLTSNTTASVNLSGYSNQTVYLHVRVADASAYATASVTLSSPLAAPSSVSLSSSGSATWSMVTGAASYEYQFTTSSTPDTGWTQTADTSASVSTTSYGGQTLYVHVRAYGSTNAASASASIPYAAPATASLTSGGVASWSAVTNAASYEYQVTPSMSPGMSWTTTYATTVNVSLTGYSNQTVYLYVRATGGSSYVTASVTLQAAAPTGLSLNSTGTASWNSVAGATYYEYQITTSSTPTSSWTQTMSASGYQDISSYSGQTVYLHVRVLGSSNYASTSILVSSGVQGGEALAAPTSVSLSSSGSASWSTVSGATGYEYNLTTSSTPMGSWTTAYATSVSVDLSGYSSGQTVYLHVRALSSQSYGTASTTISSSSSSNEPSGSNSLPAPSSASINSGGTAFWSAVAGASSYQYQITLASTPTSSWQNTPGTTAYQNLSGYSGQTVYLFARASGSQFYATASVSLSSTPSGSGQNQQNTGPIFPSGIAAQSGTVGVAYSYTIPSDAATDADGDSLSYTVSNPPAWLSFNTGTRVLSGTPTSTGTFSLTVNVSDGRGGTNSTTVDFTISGNQSPTLPAISGKSATPSVAFSTTLPEATDPENGVITYSVQNLPEWASFSAVTRIILGTPPIESQGTVTLVTYTATDDQGSTVQRSFNITVEANANAPTIANPIPDQTATINEVFSYAIPGNFASDPDGDSVTIVSVANLPSGVSYYSGSTLISGTPVATGTSTVQVTVSDGRGRTSLDSFTFTVAESGTNTPLYSSFQITQSPIIWTGNALGGTQSLWNYMQYNDAPDYSYVSNNFADLFNLTFTEKLPYISSSVNELYNDSTFETFRWHQIDIGPFNQLSFMQTADYTQGYTYFKEVATFTIDDGVMYDTASLVLAVTKGTPVVNTFPINSDGFQLKDYTDSIEAKPLGEIFTSLFTVSTDIGAGYVELTNVTITGPGNAVIIAGGPTGRQLQISIGPFNQNNQTGSVLFNVTDGYRTSYLYGVTLVSVGPSGGL